MKVIRNITTATLDDKDKESLKQLATNISLCRNEHTLGCKACPFYNVDDACIPTLAMKLLEREKKKNDI